MKLWLDDLRPAPESGWICVTSADDAIKFLKTGEVKEISLDHDLDFEHYGNLKGKEKTGFDVVLWMEKNNIWPEKIKVHSMNPVGKKRMEEKINRRNT